MPHGRTTRCTRRCAPVPRCFASPTPTKAILRSLRTSDYGYVRLRRTHYDDADLSAWVERIAAQPLARTYVYFMHEDEALGTGFARRLEELWSAAGSSR